MGEPLDRDGFHEGVGHDDLVPAEGRRVAIVSRLGIGLEQSAYARQDCQQILAADYVNIPLYAFPSMLSYRTDQLTGPLDQFINNPESNFWNLWAWEKK